MADDYLFHPCIVQIIPDFLTCIVEEGGVMFAIIRHNTNESELHFSCSVIDDIIKELD